uniref:HD domain-containing protein n=1 Tax=candidate division WOR-3 bacterium TaxID=2052148 RepID=A0A7V3VTX5_UNCW3
MLVSQLTFSFFLTLFLLSIGLLYLYFKNNFDKKFLYAGLFFFSGAGFLFSSYLMNLEIPPESIVFWNKFMFACIFAFFYCFPHFIYSMLDKPYTKKFSLLSGIFSAIIIFLLFATDLFIKNKTIEFAGHFRALKTNLNYFIVFLLILWTVYLFYDVIKYFKNKKPQMIDVRPMIAGIIIAIVFGTVDIVGTFLNIPVIPAIPDPFIFGIFFLMITFAWSFLSQYSIIFANLSKSREEIENLIAKSNKSFLEFVQLIAKTLDAKDEYTAGHSLRVLDYAMKIAEELNLSKNDKELLKQACLLHDIGKIGIPDGILNKKGKLTEKEMMYIKNHPILAKKILGTVGDFQPILEIVYSHHERVDGKGYPEGLRHDKIPLLARIIAVADTFDAMTSERPYRRAKTKEEAIEELKRVKDTQLDGEIVDIFIKILNTH